MTDALRPDARSPYQRHAKTPWKYPGWVIDKRSPPIDIQRELRAAGGWTDKKGRPRDVG